MNILLFKTYIKKKKKKYWGASNNLAWEYVWKYNLMNYIDQRDAGVCMIFFINGNLLCRTLNEKYFSSSIHWAVSLSLMKLEISNDLLVFILFLNTNRNISNVIIILLLYL